MKITCNCSTTHVDKIFNWQPWLLKHINVNGYLWSIKML